VDTLYGWYCGHTLRPIGPTLLIGPFTHRPSALLQWHELDQDGDGHVTMEEFMESVNYEEFMDENMADEMEAKHR
jgi:hypothetical protein